MPLTILENLTIKNLSYYTVPVVYLLTIAPNVYAFADAGRRFTVRSSRKSSSERELESDQAFKAVTTERLQRAEALQRNGFENLGFFAAAVVAGNVAGLPTRTLNSLSVGYVLSRFVYSIVCLNTTRELDADVTRFGVYLAGIGCIVSLFTKAGNAMNLLKL